MRKSSSLILLFLLASLLIQSTQALSINSTRLMKSNLADFLYTQYYVLKIDNPSGLENLSLLLFLNSNSHYIKLINYSIYSHPKAKVFKSQGNLTLVWSNINSNEVEVKSEFNLNERAGRKVNVSYSLPVFYKLTGRNSSILNFTKKTRRYDYDSSFKELASKIISNSPDEFTAVSKIVLWVNHHMSYNLSLAGENLSASKILKIKKGVCSHYSTLAVALLRSIGIPAREVVGFAYSDLPSVNGFGPHSWIEVYFPNDGWVQFDPTYGECGGVDISHIPVRDYHYVMWFGDNVNVDWLKNNDSVKLLFYSNEEDPVKLSVHFFKDSVGIDSYNVVYATVKNLEPYYSAYCFNLSTCEGVNVVSPGLRCVFLEPLQSKNISWIVKLAGLDKMYVYTLPVVVYSGIAYKRSEFHASVTLPSYSLDDALLFKEKIDYHPIYKTSKLIISCRPEFLYYYNNNITCDVVNVGSNTLHAKVCLDNVCKSSRLFVHSNRSFVFRIKPSGRVFNRRLILTAENYSTALQLNIPILNAPSYSLNVSFLNSSDSNYNFLVVINGSGAYRKELVININSYSLSVVPKDSFILSIPKYYFHQGKNTLSLKLIAYDKNLKVSEFSYTKIINADFSFFEKLRLFFRRLFSLLGL